jgi:hypothetical protein
MLTYWRSISMALFFAGLLLAQSNPVENFDLTGLPPKPTNYAEQRLVDMVERHQPGDVRDAVVIQQKLAEYYRQKGDAARARVADERARSAQQAAAPPQGASPAVQSVAGTGASVVGEYVCLSMGSRPCDTQKKILLRDNGTWRWSWWSGQYQVAGGQVTFEGTVGLGSWGPAVIGPDTLTFGSDRKVVWQKPSSVPPSVAGTYVCATAPGGCHTGHAIKIQSDGTWSWGPLHGYYSIVGGQVKFTGLSSGPAGWGFAEFSNGALIFRNSRGSSEWRKQ